MRVVTFSDEDADQFVDWIRTKASRLVSIFDGMQIGTETGHSLFYRLRKTAGEHCVAIVGVDKINVNVKMVDFIQKQIKSHWRIVKIPYLIKMFASSRFRKWRWHYDLEIMRLLNNTADPDFSQRKVYFDLVIAYQRQFRETEPFAFSLLPQKEAHMYSLVHDLSEVGDKQVPVFDLYEYWDGKQKK
jgi:hypothetical protein